MGAGVVRGPRVLVLSDSHGTPYAGRSYSAGLADLLARRTVPGTLRLISFSGIPLVKWADQLPAIFADEYDVVVLQYGNADVHPRLRLRFREAVRMMTGVSLRDSWFQVPPHFGPKFAVKFPFHVFKRLLVAAMGPESYTSVDHLLELFREVRARLREGARFVAVPLFPVQRWLYGSSHNRMVAEFNDRLCGEIGPEVLRVPDLPRFVSDGFHWTEDFHWRLAELISKRIPQNLTDHAGEASGAP